MCVPSTILWSKTKANFDRRSAFDICHNLTTAALEKGEETFSITAGGKDNILGFTLDAVVHSTSLERLNQRNRQRASPVRIGSIRRPDRSGEPTALENCSPHLKRFARQGGPDPRFLRGVIFAEVMSRPLLICSLRPRSHRFRHTTLSSSMPISTVTIPVSLRT